MSRKIYEFISNEKRGEISFRLTVSKSIIDYYDKYKSKTKCEGEK